MMLNEANIDEAARLVDRKKVLNAIRRYSGNIVISMGWSDGDGDYVTLDADEAAAILDGLISEIDGRLIEIGVSPTKSEGET